MLTLAVAAAGLGWLAYSYHRRKYRPIPPNFSGSSEKLTQTAILADLSQPIPPEKSAIWCLNLELAWVKARREIFEGGPILRDHPLADRLNASAATWQGPAAQLNLTVRQQCPTPEELQIELVSDLRAQVPFTLPFFDCSHSLGFKGCSVRCFGIRDQDEMTQSRLRRQVSILYQENQQFIVDPCVTSEPFRLLMARVNPKPTLLAAIEHVRKLCSSSEPRSLGSKSTLLIPTQCWEIQHQYPELSGPFTPPPPFIRAEIQATQRLQFRLDRSGAEMMSQVNLLFFGTAWSRPPAHYHFDQPFLMLLEVRATGQIVMAAWIENPELLVPF